MRSTFTRAAGVVTLLAVLGGCARPGTVPAAASPLEAAAQYQQISISIFGTAAQRLAAEAQQTADVQNRIAICMAAAGHLYTPAPSEGQAGGPQTPGDLTSLAPIGADFGIATAKQNAAEAVDQITNPGYTGLDSDAARSAYGAALHQCVAPIGMPDAFHPAGATEMSTQLESIFTEIEAQPQMAGDLATYGNCLTTAGFNARDYASLYNLVQNQFPDTSDGWQEISPTPKWAAAVAYEHEAAAADASCRSDLRNTAMQLAATQLQSFADQHADQLAAAADQWAAFPS
jgi:hypothetical protein